MWKNGVFLENRTFRSQAEIIADKERKTLVIKISGYDKKEYLALIRNVINNIHRQFNTETLNPQMYILIEDEETMPESINYKYLKQLEEKQI